MSHRKILYCASTTGHIKNFHLPYIQELAQRGWEIVVCAERKEKIPDVSRFYEVAFCKKGRKTENIRCIRQMYEIIKSEKPDIVSVHTTLAAAVTRAAALLIPRSKRPQIQYTCHGYLFKESEKKGRLKYVLAEKICAPVTDLLMVMNDEDERLARKYKLAGRGKKGQEKIVRIPGMGVDFEKYKNPEAKEVLRDRFGLHREDVIFLFAGEFSGRKNQTQLLEAYKSALPHMEKSTLILAGKGEELDHCKKEAQILGLGGRVLFPGHISDMKVLYGASDICVSASRSEGLPFHIMEAMYCGLPCILSDVKGHRDLAEGGHAILCANTAQMTEAMVRLYRDEKLRSEMGQKAGENVKRYGLMEVKGEVLSKVLKA